MRAGELISGLRSLKPTANGWEACCPAHQDHKASLSVTEGEDGRILLHCHAGCPPESIVGALGLSLGDLFPSHPANSATPKPRIVDTYDYTDEKGGLLFQCVRYEPKNFKQRRPDLQKPGEWIWNLKDTRRVLYRLPEVLAAIKAGRTVFTVEGEKDVDALAKAGFAATCNPCGAGKWLPEHTETLRGAARVVVIADKDKPGDKHARAVASALRSVARSVKLVQLPDVKGKSVKDAADFFANGGTADDLRAIVKAAPDYEIEPEAKISPNRAREDAGQGSSVAFPEPEPWRDPVNGAALLEEIRSVLRRYVVASDSALAASALFVLHTYAFDLGDISPILFITGPTKRCGKSRLLSVLARLVNRPLAASSASAAAIYRTIELHRPTLLIDEVDAFLKCDEQLRGLVNSGHTRDAAFHLGCVAVGRDFEPCRWSTWTPKILSGIGRLADTIEDRAVIIAMRRRRRDEAAERLRHGTRFEDLRRKCARFVSDNADAIRAANPTIPDALNDRAADNWTPLLTLAELASGDWPAIARQAALALSGSEEAEKPLSPNQLANLLRDFGVASRGVRIGDSTPRGYLRDDFADAFSCYLPANDESKRNNATKPVNIGENSLFQNATSEPCCVSENATLINDDGACCGVAFQKAQKPDASEDRLLL